LAIDQQTVGSLVVNDKSITDITALEVGNVGENIAVRRATYLRAAGDKQLIASYVHSTGNLLCAEYQSVYSNTEHYRVVETFLLGCLVIIPIED